MIKRNIYKVEGNSLSVLEKGSKTQSTVLFLHGIPASAELWRSVMERFTPENWRCLAPDLPGYGTTEMQSGADYSLNATAHLLIRWLQEENLSQVWLVGHDIGGGVAQLMVSKREDLFSRLTLSNCITSDTWPVKFITDLIRLARLRLYAILALTGMVKKEKFYHQLQKSFANPEALDMDSFERIYYDGKFHRWSEALKFQRMLRTLNNQETVDNMAALKNVNIPVHLVWGMKDIFQSWDGPGKILERTFKNVKVNQIKDSGHFLQLDITEEYFEAIMSYQESSIKPKEDHS